MSFRIAVSLAPILGLMTLGAGPALAGGDPGRGQQAFVICGACHNGGGGAGPSLDGVVGRAAAAAEGYAAYTPALKNSGLVWTEENLDEFLASPFTVVPGTSMVFPVADAQQRADLIAYLKTLDTQ